MHVNYFENSESRYCHVIMIIVYKCANFFTYRGYILFSSLKIQNDHRIVGEAWVVWLHYIIFIWWNEPNYSVGVPVVSLRVLDICSGAEYDHGTDTLLPAASLSLHASSLFVKTGTTTVHSLRLCYKNILSCHGNPCILYDAVWEKAAYPAAVFSKVKPFLAPWSGIMLHIHVYF